MPAIGLDIGSSSIKIAQLEKRGSQFALLAAGIVSTPPNIPVLESEQDITLVAEAVRKLLNDTKIVSKSLALSIPESQAFTRLVKLPYLSDHEVDSAVSWQMEQYIPIPVAEATSDYRIVKRSQPQGNDAGSVEVLLVAAPKAIVAKYVKVCGLLDLSVESVETNLISLSRAVSANMKTFLLADIGSAFSSFSVVREGQVVVSRSISTGGSVLTRAISSALSVNTQQAEEYKKTYGIDKKQLEGKLAAVLEPTLRILVDEIKKTIHYFKSEIDDKENIATLVVGGGSAALPELAPFLTENLGLEVVVADPFARLIKDERVSKTFSTYGPLYGVAIGLAEGG